VKGQNVWLKTLNLALMGGTPQLILLFDFFLCLFILFYVLFSCVILVFAGTSVVEFKFGGMR
jgi:hypothetical protein